uniref:Major facilitator superfamily (MFS) profile domain-containing protein n=1 Tax=Chromera velia CCMP2878 TaxID=1169474 RepID=A0A0G4FVK9_9ALVE|eukprot:Cvel_18977.t1-p1 / transcript=Cvel_18977.t1 / gene=Cvel_18977 / organism=Chromera_velia_CCMP2878 / gene_product=hypothetical protein / transcript_product=hypothetical protein / location=Cvel_scaffold1604:9548-11551(-) / protein_length=668 / sequence_SO=supercontig / SO=protein_coding / is_pseudo=false
MEDSTPSNSRQVVLLPRASTERQDEEERFAKNRKNNLKLTLFVSALITTLLAVAQGAIFDSYVFLLSHGKNEAVGITESILGLVSLVSALPLALLVDRYDRVLLCKVAGALGFVSIGAFVTVLYFHSIFGIRLALVLWGLFWELLFSSTGAIFADSVEEGARAKWFARKGLTESAFVAVGPGLMYLFFCIWGDKWDIDLIVIPLILGNLLFGPVACSLLFLYRQPFSPAEGEEEAEGSRRANGEMRSFGDGAVGDDNVTRLPSAASMHVSGNSSTHWGTVTASASAVSPTDARSLSGCAATSDGSPREEETDDSASPFYGDASPSGAPFLQKDNGKTRGGEGEAAGPSAEHPGVSLLRAEARRVESLSTETEGQQHGQQQHLSASAASASTPTGSGVREGGGSRGRRRTRAGIWGRRGRGRGGNEVVVLTGWDQCVPFLVATSNFVACIGAGMTVKFFPLFFQNDYSFTPKQSSLLFFTYPLSVALFIKAAELAAKRFGRVPVSVVSNILGASCLIGLAYVRSLPLLVAIFLMRGGLSNGTNPLDKSILMDYTPSKHRGKWNAVESLTGMTWSGSAFLGGWLADFQDYRFAFGVTAGLYFLAVAIFIPLLWIVPLKEDDLKEQRRLAAEERQRAERANGSGSAEGEAGQEGVKKKLTDEEASTMVGVV